LRAVADVHDDVTHAPRSPPPPRSSPNVAVGSPTPKLSPDTVTDAYPLGGAFSATSDTTAASKLKIGRPVPDTAPTVTLTARNMSANAFAWQRNDVTDTHDDEKHAPRSPPPPRSSPAVAVWSATPKLSPDTVSETYPLGGVFSRTSEAAAASKLKMGLPVPDTNASVTVAALNRSPIAFDRHATVVADVHAEVKQTPRSPPPPRSRPAVAVCSPTPKASPETVTDAYPLCGTFSRTTEAAPASKLNIGTPVPETDPTVMLASMKMSANAFDRHANVVADVQDDVKHTPRSPRPPRSSAEVAL